MTHENAPGFKFPKSRCKGFRENKIPAPAAPVCHPCLVVLGQHPMVGRGEDPLKLPPHKLPLPGSTHELSKRSELCGWREVDIIPLFFLQIFILVVKKQWSSMTPTLVAKECSIFHVYWEILEGWDRDKSAMQNNPVVLDQGWLCTEGIFDSVWIYFCPCN